jgi:hypothetical protein
MRPARTETSPPTDVPTHTGNPEGCGCIIGLGIAAFAGFVAIAQFIKHQIASD